MRYGGWLVSLGILSVLVFGCSASFHKFKAINAPVDGYTQYHLRASGNSVVSYNPQVLDTLLYEIKLNGGIGAQVIGTEQFVIVPTYNERIYFLDPASGYEKTALLTRSAVGSAAVLDGELLYFVEEAGGDRLTCFNLIKGKVLWRFRVSDPQGAPILADGDIFVTSRMGKVYRLNSSSGSIVWEYETEAQFYTSPAIGDSTVYVCTDKGKVIALGKNDGKLRWSFKTEGTIYSQPIVDRYVYCGSGDGRMYALDSEKGDLKWSFRAAAAIRTTPVLIDERLYFGSDDNLLYCVNAADGSLLWSYETDAIIQSSPIADSGSVYFGNSAGSIYQIDLNGQLIKSLKVKGSITAPLTIIGDKLYAVTRQRMLYCYRLTPAKQISSTVP